MLFAKLIPKEGVSNGKFICEAYREVETERLHLRPVTLEDAPAMFEYASDETVTRYTFPTNHSLEETRNNIALFYLASPLGRWGIELKENGKFIGTIDLLDLDLSLKKGSIGYVEPRSCDRGYQGSHCLGF